MSHKKIDPGINVTLILWVSQAGYGKMKNVKGALTGTLITWKRCYIDKINLPSLNQRLDRLDRLDSVPTSLRDRCLLFGVTTLSITDANGGDPRGFLRPCMHGRIGLPMDKQPL